MQIDNPHFYISQSLRSQRKLKRYGNHSILDAADITKAKNSKAFRRTSTMNNNQFSKIDLTQDNKNSSKRKGSSNAFGGQFKFNSKAFKNKLQRLGTRGSQNRSIVSRNPKSKLSMKNLVNLGKLSILSQV